MLRLSVDRVSDRAFVVTGELDVSTMGVFDAALAAAHDGDGAVVLDLSRVTFIDSSGLRSLIHLGRSLRGGGLILRDPQPRVRHVLEERGLDVMGLWSVEGARGLTTPGPAGPSMVPGT
jgi:anti-anti-sigma factor